MVGFSNSKKGENLSFFKVYFLKVLWIERSGELKNKDVTNDSWKNG